MQHVLVYLKDKSSKSALHGTFKRSLYSREYTLPAFLNIEGAFNNVQTESMMETLEALGVEHILTE